MQQIHSSVSSLRNANEETAEETAEETRVPRAGYPAFLAAFWWLLALFPLLALVLVARQYYMGFPWAEDWAFCEDILVPLWEGRLTWHDLASTANSYAKFSTWALRAPLAWFTHWNQAWEVGLNIAFGVGTWVAILEVFRQVARVAGRPYPHVLVPLLALVLLGLDKSCIWFWGDGLTYTLAIFAAIGGLAALTPSNPSILRIVLAGILGVIAAFAFASGFVYLLVAFIPLARIPERSRRYRVVAAWLFLFLGTGVLYWLNTKGKVVDRPSFEQWVARLVLTARFLPVFLGAGLVKFHLRSAGFLGMIGLLGGAAMFWKMCISGPSTRERCIPFLTFMMFALFCGVTACVCRYRPPESLYEHSYGGLLEGAALRYPFFSQFYWIGLLGLLWLQLPVSTTPGANRTGRRWLVVFSGFVLAALSILSSRTGFYEAQERYWLYGAQTQRVVIENLPSLPRRLQWPFGAERREALRLLRTHELSFCRPEARSFWISAPVRRILKP